ncbi:MAG: hypothetical protein E2O57_02345 [Gammaproteobacteria bacterium]|nr:MAG: hypothetical protein E2O57_02345 [Gammaproteobacteria bacterium]
MIETFQIKSSTSQAVFLVSIYALTLVVGLIYIDSVLSLSILSGLVLLLAIIEFRNWLQQQTVTLSLNPGRDSIGLEQAGKAQIYDKYKVYTCRWFAILQLVDNRKHRSLLLNSDRFISTGAYQDFRFVIQHMQRQGNERGSNAD